MTHVQLIEKVDLPTQVWLTFWDLDERAQLSMEIGSPENAYRVGEVFELNRDGGFEKLALRPVALTNIDTKKLLIPLPKQMSSRPARQRRFPSNMVTVYKVTLGRRAIRSRKKTATTPSVPKSPEREHVSLLMID